MTNIIGWFKRMAFVLSHADEFARLLQEVDTLNKRVKELETATVNDTINLDKPNLVTGVAFKNAVIGIVEGYDLEELLSSAIDNSNVVEEAVENYAESWLNNQDWDYILRDSIDWDKVADRVTEKLDWDTIISDNEVVTRNDIDLDDVMLKSDHLSEDDLVTRADLSDMVVGELKRDWFESKLRDDIGRIFKDTLYAARDTEMDNARNAIDDEIEVKVDTLIREQLQAKFGPTYDEWFNGFVLHAVKASLAEMLQAAYTLAVSQQNKEEQS